MRVVAAPDAYFIRNDEITCFLAGGITGCPNWQQEVIDYISSYPEEYTKYLVILNPRRENFPIDDPDAADLQIEWEFKGLEHCDIFSMYFCNAPSDQPICMYELGRNVVRMEEKFKDDHIRTIVTVEPGYRKEKDVSKQLILSGSHTFLFSKSYMNYDINPKHHAEAIVQVYNVLRRDYIWRQ